MQVSAKAVHDENVAVLFTKSEGQLEQDTHVVAASLLSTKVLSQKNKKVSLQFIRCLLACKSNS